MNEPIITNELNEPARIVYIEYQDGKPHAVIVCGLNDTCQEHYDFNFTENSGGYQYFNSGCGGDIKEIQGPHYRQEYEGASCWICDIADSNNFKPINCKKLDTPILLDNITYDPFRFAEGNASRFEYCKFCDKHYNEDGCSHHMDMWEHKYFDGTEIE